MMGPTCTAEGWDRFNRLSYDGQAKSSSLSFYEEDEFYNDVMISDLDASSDVHADSTRLRDMGDNFTDSGSPPQVAAATCGILGLAALLHMHAPLSNRQSRDFAVTRHPKSDTLFAEAAVRYMDLGPCVVDSEVVRSRRNGERETLAMPPGSITVALPSEFIPGQPFVVRGGPHSRLIRVTPQSDSAPCGELELELRAPPELTVYVPAGRNAGESLVVRRYNGMDIVVSIPIGKQAGDTFTFTPPTLMVAAPEESDSGDFVVFRHYKELSHGSTHADLFRAKVPQQLLYGRYFAARLPMPVEDCSAMKSVFSL